LAKNITAIRHKIRPNATGEKLQPSQMNEPNNTNAIVFEQWSFFQTTDEELFMPIPQGKKLGCA
jgi:hypothetical protein